MALPKAKWGVAYTFEVPVIKRGVVDFAVSADWTPASGDSKVSKDGGNVANTTNLPAILGGTGAALWQQTLTATEMQCSSRVEVQWVDSATKAVEDQAIVIEMDYGIRSNTAQAGAATTITLDASASATDDFYRGEYLEIISGTGVGQIRRIASYNGTSKVATVNRAWATNPDSTSIFRIGNIHAGEVDVTHVSGTSQTAGDIPGILGALNASASSGDPGTTTTIVAYLKQLINTLEGSAGIPTFPAAAAPANAVSLAEVIRSIYTQIGVAGAGLTAVGDTRLGNLDAAVSTRLASAGYTAPLDAAGTRSAMGLGAANLDTQLSGINSKTTNLPASPASEGNVTAVGLAVTALGSPMQAGSYTAPDNSTIATINTKLGTPAASVSADIAAVKTDTGNLVTRITANLFSGITYLSRWLGAIAGKTADTVTRAEINATTAGAGYNETTDSQEAIRDRGDAAWITGSSSASGPTAAEIADAVWDESISGHLTSGSTGAKLNTAAAGGGGGTIVASLALPKAQAREVLQDNDLICQIGSTLRFSFTGVDALGDISGRTGLIFTAKTSKGVADASATIQITEAGGLTKLNGAASTSAWGLLTVTDATLGEVDITLYAAATASLEAARGLVWDIKEIIGSSPADAVTLTEGVLNVETSVTRATS